MKFLKHLHANHGGRRLWEGLPKVRFPDPRTVTITPEEYTRLLQASPPWLRLFVLLISQMALRAKEAFTVAPKDHVAGCITIRTKGGQKRTIPTTPDVETMFAAVDHGGDAQTPFVWQLGTWTAPGEPNLSTAQARILKAWQKAKKAANVREEVHPHDLRRTAATIVYRQTHDLKLVQQLLGHKRLASTLHYLAPHEPEEIRPILWQLWPGASHGKETVQ